MNFYCLPTKHNFLQFLKQRTEFIENIYVGLQSSYRMFKMSTTGRGACVQRRLRKSLLIVVGGKSSRICCSALFSSGVVLGFEWSLWNAWRLHPTHDSQVGWGLENLVAIHPLR